MSSADIQKSATGITFSSISLLLNSYCSEAALMKMTCTVYFLNNLTWYNLNES